MVVEKAEKEMMIRTMVVVNRLAQAILRPG